LPPPQHIQVFKYPNRDRVNDDNLSKDSVTWRLRGLKEENTKISILTSIKTNGSKQIVVRSVRFYFKHKVRLIGISDLL